LARGLGKGIRDFKDASEGVKREIHRNINSVGIKDDVDSIINDFNSVDRQPSSVHDASASTYGDTERNGINLEKTEVEVGIDNQNSRIETDKTQL